MKEIKNILFFIKYIKPQWKTLLTVIVLTIVATGIGLYLPIINKPKDPTPSKPDKPNTIQKIINTVKTGDTTNIVAWFLIAIVSLGLIVGLYKKRKMK